MPHPTDDCLHNETFMHISATLKRLDRHTERTAIAMEEMAAQGAIIKNHEARINKHDVDISEAFGQLRMLQDTTASVEDIDQIRLRVHTIEIGRATAAGAEEIIGERRRFWDGIKQQMTTNLLLWVGFAIWTIDRFNVAQKIAVLFKKMGEYP